MYTQVIREGEKMQSSGDLAAAAAACADMLLSKVPLYSRELRLVAVPVSREDRFPARSTAGGRTGGRADGRTDAPPPRSRSPGRGASDGRGRRAKEHRPPLFRRWWAASSVSPRVSARAYKPVMYIDSSLLPRRRRFL